MKSKDNKAVKEKKSVGKVWPIVLCLALAAGIFVFLLNMETKQLAKYDKGKVVVTLTTVNKDTEITKENVNELFAMVDRPLTDIPEASCVELSDLVGQYVQSRIDEGSMVTKSMIGKLETSYTGMVILSVNMEALDQSVAGILRAGDEIDIYSIDVNEAEEVLVDRVLNKVQIIRSYTSTGASISKDDSASIAQYITIPVHKDAVESFYKALENRKIEIVKHP